MSPIIGEDITLHRRGKTTDIRYPLRKAIIRSVTDHLDDHLCPIEDLLTDAISTHIQGYVR